MAVGLINLLLVILSIIFGSQAVLMFNEKGMGEVLEGLHKMENHKKRLLYASVFLGSTLIALSIVQGARYVSEIQISYIDLAILFVNLSFLGITYSWYAFLKDL